MVGNKLTCGNKTHEAVESLYRLRGQSRFQLQKQLQHARVAHPNDGIAEERSLEEVADEEGIDEEFIVNDDASMGVLPMVAATSTNFPQLQVKKRVKANFGRKRTHNEQVLVTPCGVILARETFYGAEAISTCVVSKRRQHSYVVLTLCHRNSSSTHFESVVKCQTTSFSITTAHSPNM